MPYILIQAPSPRAHRSVPPPNHADSFAPQLFYSFFKTLVGKEVVVELKNGPPAHHIRPKMRTMAVSRLTHTADLAIRGTLHSVDQYLNIKLLNVSVDDVENYPHMVRAACLRLASLAPQARPCRRSNP